MNLSYFHALNEIKSLQGNSVSNQHFRILFEVQNQRKKIKSITEKKTAVSRYPFAQSEKIFGVRYNYGS